MPEDEMTAAVAELLGERIVSRIVELSTFDYNHEGWWTLCRMMGEPVPALRGFDDEDFDVQVLDLWNLIADVPALKAQLTEKYRNMRENGGRYRP